MGQRRRAARQANPVRLRPAGVTLIAIQIGGEDEPGRAGSGRRRRRDSSERSEQQPGDRESGGREFTATPQGRERGAGEPDSHPG